MFSSGLSLRYPMMFSLLTCVQICLILGLTTAIQDVSILTHLSDKLQNLEVTSGEYAGLYESRYLIHVPPKLAHPVTETRHFDNNIYITLWVNIALLEASMYYDLPQLTSPQLLTSTDSSFRYHDLNAPGISSMICFYPQTYNVAAATWQCHPPIYNHSSTHAISKEKIEVWLQEEGWPKSKTLPRLMTQP